MKKISLKEDLFINKIEIGKYLKKLRENLKLTQED